VTDKSNLMIVASATSVGAVTVAETEIPSLGPAGLFEESRLRTEIEARRGRVASPGSEPAGNGSDEIGRENVALRRLVVAYQHLSSLAAQDADVQTVTELIAESVGTAVALVDQRLVAAERFFTAQVPEAITAIRGDEVVIVLPEPD
jgi:hypothetical protein